MKRIVIKIGSSSLVTSSGTIDREQIADLVKELSLLKKENIEPIIVTSGAIAVGAGKLGIKPKTIGMKQACAAIGQASLMHDYDMIFEMYSIKCAQILLNHDDFDNRKRMLNLENTINNLLENGVVPIINENDALAVEEIKVGDNDTLSALIATIVYADLLVLISDIDGLYNDNPKINKDAKLIKVVEKIDKDIEAMAGGVTSKVGTGGMTTKIKAAKIATSAGVDMIIMNNDKIEHIHDIFNDYEGTLFKASKKRLSAKMQWVLYKARPKGYIVVDEGAKNAVLARRSLLPKGIKDVYGKFAKDDVVSIKCAGIEIARGIANYDNEDIKKIKGHQSSEVNSILGHDGKNVVIHANGMILIEVK